MMASPCYQPLVSVLQGLRAHDERALEKMLLHTASSRGRATSVVALDPARAADEESEEAEGEEAAQAGDDGATGGVAAEEAPRGRRGRRC